MWLNATTFAPFGAELAYAASCDPILGGGAAGGAGGGAGTKAGLTWVLKSLTPTHRRVLAILADHGENDGAAAAAAVAGPDDDEADRAADDGPGGARAVRAAVQFDYLLEECRSSLLLSNDLQLRTHLVELTDHALVATSGTVVQLLVPPARLLEVLGTM